MMERSVCDVCKEIPQELDSLQRFIGQRVLITAADHPYQGETGTVSRLEHAHALGQWGFVVNYDSGLSGFVFKGSD